MNELTEDEARARALGRAVTPSPRWTASAWSGRAGAQAVAAPFATRQLADLGARVIKVERAGGGDFARDYDRTVLGQSSYFVWLNRAQGKHRARYQERVRPGRRSACSGRPARASRSVRIWRRAQAERLGWVARSSCASDTPA